MIVSSKDAAWESCNDFEQVCGERIRTYVRFVQTKFSEMREEIGDTEKAGVDWLNDCVRQLQREVCELRSSEDKLDQLSLIDDPIQFLKVMGARCAVLYCSCIHPPRILP